MYYDLTRKSSTDEETITVAKSLIKSWKKLVPENEEKKKEKEKKEERASAEKKESKSYPKPGFSGELSSLF